MDYTLRTRRERYVFERLDVNLNRVGALAGVRDCSLDWSIWGTYRGSGDLTIRTASEMVWPQILVRPWIVVENESGREATPLMTCVCRVPDQDFTPKGVEADVQLFDRTIILDEWLLRERYLVLAGTKYTDAMASVFSLLGITTYSITPGTGTLARDFLWIPEESEPISWMNVLNDLADAAGYFGVWADARGWFQLHPYIAPAQRLPKYRLADDGVSHRYLPRVNIARAGFMTYNAWSYWSRTDGTTAPQEWYRENSDPAHPYSTASLGRVIMRRKTDIEGDVASMIERDRAEDMADQRTFTLEARYLPVIEHEVIRLENKDALLSTYAAVAKRSLDCRPGAKLGLTLREVS